MMKNNLFAFTIAFFMAITPQIALSDDGKPAGLQARGRRGDHHLFRTAGGAGAERIATKGHVPLVRVPD